MPAYDPGVACDLADAAIPTIIDVEMLSDQMLGFLI